MLKKLCKLIFFLQSLNVISTKGRNLLIIRKISRRCGRALTGVLPASGTKASVPVGRPPCAEPPLGTPMLRTGEGRIMPSPVVKRERAAARQRQPGEGTGAK